MNRYQKKLFIRQICNAVRDDLVKKIRDMPEEWDGHELRRLLADKFEREAWTLGPGQKRSNSLGGQPSKRYRDFLNECLTRNL